MRQRELGKTGIMVSEVGLGAWQLGNDLWGSGDEGEALRIVDTAIDQGCNFFDTAPGYGGGRSEILLGQALRGRREEVVICSKFGHTPEGESDFSAERLRESLEGTLERLQTDYVDVLLLHNPPRELLDGASAPHYAVLEELKREGLIRAYGASVDWREELETLANTTGSEAAEILFNAFHQEPLGAFKQAYLKGLGLIVKVPLDSGWLSGKYSARSSFDDVRGRWTPEQIRRRGALVDAVRSFLPEGLEMGHAALRYILAHAEVSTVIPGAKSAAQVQENIAAAARPLPRDVLRQLYELWEREIKGDPLPW
jgi:aryl-alcohol dehydrogenase-like predicted oxidoreductase